MFMPQKTITERRLLELKDLWVNYPSWVKRNNKKIHLIPHSPEVSWHGDGAASVIA
jgi:hypothetical protein